MWPATAICTLTSVAVLPAPAGEAESDEDEWEDGESELTQAALRQLQQSPQFQGYLRVRRLRKPLC